MHILDEYENSTRAQRSKEKKSVLTRHRDELRIAQIAFATISVGGFTRFFRIATYERILSLTHPTETAEKDHRRKRTMEYKKEEEEDKIRWQKGQQKYDDADDDDDDV